MSPVTHRGRRRLERDRPVERLRGLLDDDLVETGPVGDESPGNEVTGALPPDDEAVGARPDPGSSAGPQGRTEAPQAQSGAAAVRLRLPWVSLLIAAVVLVLVVVTVLTRGAGEQEVIGTAPGTLSAEDPAVGAAGDAPSSAGETAQPLPTAGPGTSSTPPVAGSEAAALTVHVVGEVQRPGVVEVPAGSRVSDAVEAAGGLKGSAVVDAVNLAAPAADGAQIMIPDQTLADAWAEAGPPGAAPSGATGASPGPGASAVPSSPQTPGSSPGGAGPIDLNTAAAAELEELPRVGPVLAQRIIDHRDQIGGFRAVEELDDVSGIGPAMMEAIAPLVTV